MFVYLGALVLSLRSRRPGRPPDKVALRGREPNQNRRRTSFEVPSRELIHPGTSPEWHHERWQPRCRQRPIDLPPRYIPELDGLHGIAIAMVIAFHFGLFGIDTHSLIYTVYRSTVEFGWQASICSLCCLAA